jgi:hypothetical protein
MRFIRVIVAIGVTALLTAGCKQKTDSNEQSSAPPNNGMRQGVVTSTDQNLSGNAAAGSVRGTIDRDKALFDLNQIATAYNDIWSANPNGPSRLEDLYAHLGGPQSPISQGLANGKYKIYLNVNVFSLQDKSNTVLAYYSGVPTSGGPVLMADGNVTKNMSPDDFKNAPKAGQ